MSERPSSRDWYRGDGGPRSAGQLFKEISEDFSTLFRKEVELAKQELGAAVNAKVKGAAIIGIAGVMGFFALIFILLALRDGLDSFLWRWVSDLITAAVLLLVGAIGALVARRKLATPISADLTKQTIKEDVEMAKSLGKRKEPPPAGAPPPQAPAPEVAAPPSSQGSSPPEG